jgi:hypothetical protein
MFASRFLLLCVAAAVLFVAAVDGAAQMELKDLNFHKST